MRRCFWRQRAPRPRRPSAATLPEPEIGPPAQTTRTRVTPLSPSSHHGHGLRASLAFDPLHAVLSLRPGQRRADHDRGETCGFTSRPRGRTVAKSPVRSTGTAARMSAQLVRESLFEPMEDGWAPTLARIDRRSGVAPRRRAGFVDRVTPPDKAASRSFAHSAASLTPQRRASAGAADTPRWFPPACARCPSSPASRVHRALNRAAGTSPPRPGETWA